MQAHEAEVDSPATDNNLPELEPLPQESALDMISVGHGPNVTPKTAMVFVDGTNLLYRLLDNDLVVPKLQRLVFYTNLFAPPQVARICFYTVPKHFNDAKQRHGPEFFEGIRVIFGDEIPRDGGNVKEKAVDALLVADLIYHAAARNYNYAVLVSVDTDFVYAINRVEDFGCRSAVLGICADIPDRLKAGCDEHQTISAATIIASQLGHKAPQP